jgi:hypothetical protein
MLLFVNGAIRSLPLCGDACRSYKFIPWASCRMNAAGAELFDDPAWEMLLPIMEDSATGNLRTAITKI